MFLWLKWLSKWNIELPMRGVCRWEEWYRSLQLRKDWRQLSHRSIFGISPYLIFTGKMNFLKELNRVAAQNNNHPNGCHNANQGFKNSDYLSDLIRSCTYSDEYHLFYEVSSLSSKNQSGSFYMSTLSTSPTPSSLVHLLWPSRSWTEETLCRT